MNTSEPTLLEASNGQPLNVRPSYQVETGNALLANSSIATSAERGASDSLTATPFYSMAKNVEIYNPRVAELRSIAYKLVETGLATDKEIATISVRINHMSEPTPAANRGPEQQYAKDSKNPIAEFEKSGLPTPSASYFAKDSMNLDEQEIRSFFPNNPNALRQTFLHELGHASRRNDTEELVADLTAGPLRNDHPDKQGANAPGSVEKTPNGLSATNNWGSAIEESKADAFAIVAIQALDGKEKALTAVDALLLARDQESVRVLVSGNLHGGLLEGHHTSETLSVLREKIVSGEVAEALSQGNGQKLVMDSVKEGVKREHDNISFAELNPHTLSNGELRPGLPQSVALADALKLSNPESAGVVFVRTVEYEELKVHGQQLAGFDLAGRKPLIEVTSPELAAQGLTALEVPSGNTKVYIQDQSGQTKGLELQSKIESFGQNFPFVKAEEAASHRAAQANPAQSSVAPQHKEELARER